MWILPKQLHTSVFVPDTTALDLGLPELFEICASSLLARSKLLPARTWSRKWNKVCWTRHLSGRILKPSPGFSFAERYTFSLEDTHVSPSARQVNDSVKTTPDTSGLGSKTGFTSADLNSSSSRTSKDTSRLDSPQSSTIWKKLVTQQRGEYSARLKSARPTKENGSSSWPTATTRDWKDGTATSCQNVPVNALLGRAVHKTPSTNGNRPGSWQTPRTTDAAGVDYQYDQGDHSKPRLMLPGQVKAWPTPFGFMGGAGNPNYGGGGEFAAAVKKVAGAGKLNPRWVECLMGVPIGWTNCDSSETGLSQQQQSAHSASSSIGC